MLGLEAAADAGGLTSFSRKRRGEDKAKTGTSKTQDSRNILLIWESHGAHNLCVFIT